MNLTLRISRQKNPSVKGKLSVDLSGVLTGEVWLQRARSMSV